MLITYLYLLLLVFEYNVCCSFAGQLRRSKRLNVIQVTDQPDDEDGDCNGEQYIAPVDDSEALDDEGDQVHNLGNKPSKNLYFSKLPLYIQTIKRINGGFNLIIIFPN